MTEYYEQPLPIRTYDIDFAGIVSNIVFIRWLEDLRLGLLDQAYPLLRALAEDVAPILLSTRIDYRRPVTIADPLVGRMRVAGLRRVRWRLAAEFTVRGAVHAEAERDPTAHAEMLVLRAGAARRGAKYLDGCDLYVTLEPCAMCAAAMAFARLRRLYFGAYDPKGGAVEHGPRLFEKPTTHHRPEIYGGINEERAAELLRAFFRARRDE